MPNDTDRILAAIKDAAKEQNSIHEAIWNKLDEHAKEIASIKSDVRLGNWKIGALVATAASFGWLLIKPVIEKLTKLLAL